MSWIQWAAWAMFIIAGTIFHFTSTAAERNARKSFQAGDLINGVQLTSAATQLGTSSWVAFAAAVVVGVMPS